MTLEQKQARNRRKQRRVALRAYLAAHSGAGGVPRYKAPPQEKTTRVRTRHRIQRHVRYIWGREGAAGV